MSDADAAEPVVVERGPGPVSAAVVGSIHGDEPSGSEAINRFVGAIDEGTVALDRGVRFIVANPAALEVGVRFLDADLNRIFPGDPEGNREERLAAHIDRLIAGLPTLSIHATRSQDEPMAFVHPHRADAYRIARDLPVPHLIWTKPETSGTLTERGDVVSVEAGRQGSRAAIATAESLIRSFLIAVEVLEGTLIAEDPEEFVLDGPIEKPNPGPYSVLASNFERVEVGQPFAMANGVKLVAEEAFYPVLLSPDGYESIFGFRAHRADQIDRPRSGR